MSVPRTVEFFQPKSNPNPNNFAWLDPFRKTRPREKKGSMTLRKWLKFYNQSFGLKPNLADFIKFNEPGHGISPFLMPSDLSLVPVLDLFKDKVSKININIADYDDPLLNKRQSEHSYIAYQKYGETLIEHLVFDLFLLFQGKSILLNDRLQHHNFGMETLKNGYAIKRPSHRNQVMLKRMPFQRVDPLKTYSINELEYWIIQR